MGNSAPFTVTELLASASKTLEKCGYKRVELDKIDSNQGTNARLFEDDYGIVAVFVYATWGDLSLNWVDAQAFLVELISKYITSYDAKSWEGYLVLLTPGVVGKADRTELTKIRYDTSRVRKLVATSDDIKTLDDVRQSLLPLLPLEIEATEEYKESVLALLPGMLSDEGIPEKAVQIVVTAFVEERPIVESLHEYRKSSENKVD